MKKKEIGIISILVIITCLVIFNITKSNIEKDNIQEVIASLNSSTTTLKGNETITLNVQLNTSSSLQDKINIFRGKINYDKSIFEEITLDDIKINGTWSNLEYNQKTDEFIILNFKTLNDIENVMSINLKTQKQIPNVEKTSIGISKMETASWDMEEELVITNENGNILEEIFLTKEKKDEPSSSTSPIKTTSSTTTTKTTTKKTTIKPTTTSKNILTTTKTIIIPPRTTTTKRIISTTRKASKKTTTKKETTSKSIKTTSSQKIEKEATTTKKANKSFFEKNNNANKKVLVIVLVVLIILIALAIYKYHKFKNINIFMIIFLLTILFNYHIVNALTAIKGDIDYDGKISIKDITNLEKYLVDLESAINDNTRKQADLNEDGNISTIDLAILIHLFLEPNQDEDITFSGPTAEEALKEIKIGWNLGNALDSTNYRKEYLGEEKNITYYETLWGNPITTQAMIDKVKEAGFNSVRVPVTYYDHILNDGTIDEKWFKRVEEVINYVLNNNLYCILDMHHDTGLYEGGSWIVADVDKYEENATKLKNIWIQVANRFKDYDHKLIFEGLNETVDTNRQGYDWNTGTEITKNVLKLNQVFVDTVRSTGGKNKNRILAVTTYGGITDEHKLSLFTMPNDIVENKIILALHDYADEESNIDTMMQRLKKYVVDKNIPVMLDEFGTKTSMGDNRRASIVSYYVSKAKNLGIPCFVWDDGGNYQIFNRRNLTWKYPKTKDALINAAYEK